MIDNKSMENQTYSVPTPDNYSPSVSTYDDISPTRLLTTAMRKRRSLLNTKNPDLRVELLIGATIKNLCKFIGEQRASSVDSFTSRSHRKRRHSSSHRKRSRRFDDVTAAIDADQSLSDFSDQCSDIDDENDSVFAGNLSKIRKIDPSADDQRRDVTARLRILVVPRMRIARIVPPIICVP